MKISWSWYLEQPLIEEKAWRDALAIIDPSLDPTADEVVDARGKAECAVWLVCLSQSSQRRQIIKLLATARRFRDELNEVDALRIPADYITNVDKLCALLKSRHIDSSRHSDAAANTKATLHGSVQSLYHIWTELNQGKTRQKREFVTFAHACLRHAKAGITHNSVLESFDRHVRPNLIRAKEANTNH